MNRSLALSLALVLGLAACGTVPYRTDEFAEYPECRKIYDEKDDISARNRNEPKDVAASRCWLRSREEREDYDLLFVEFDDQGWVQGSPDLSRPAKEQKDFLDKFYVQLKGIYEANQKNGLSLVLFVHGWHHNADATDSNVTEFRWLLRDLAIAENGRKLSDVKAQNAGPRVVGIYVGWRGESVTVPYLNALTFWERKNSAERVAQGSVLEVFARLDYLRDRGRANVDWDSLSKKDRPEDGKRNVRMLTIGHSFGGLITFEALSSEFVRFAARNDGMDYISRLGDVVVIVNPAVEGARYEPLMVAGQRMVRVKHNQLPVVIVATSTADWATRYAFPAARSVSTLLEATPGPEGDAIVKAVGHNDRYTTHRLALCEADDAACSKVCLPPEIKRRESTLEMHKDRRDEYSRGLAQDIREEFRLMAEIGDKGFEGRKYLCGGLQLETTPNHLPKHNPFWVVSTTGEIMDGHNDIFNRHFVSFIRQMYLGVIAVRFPRKE